MKPKTILITLLLTGVFTYALSLFIIETTKPIQYINVARFAQDTTPTPKIKGFNIHTYNLGDQIPETVNNIWITHDFLKNQNHIYFLHEYLLLGYNILIEGQPTIDFVSVYDALQIPEKNRAAGSVVTSRSDNFHTRGVLIFMHEDLYYVASEDFQYLNYPEEFYKRFLQSFDFRKENILPRKYD